ncbi:MAG: 16S rRNA (cytidine(1402)-2'-O)-methyltransferase [Anaerolineae bacterium]|nr:16S rRNA (cytidine(1402)-2'-O)-methyltransferase [Anaerolineae bacterium]MDW8098840.1 16S rRNA (cytidine(1402)-2'-O)-methyltransferase [Anaerolineae bacterium]
MGTLYVVGTPIGNLEDMTFRAVRILREVRLIAAEDTRTARILLAHFDIHTPVTSYFEHNKLIKLEAILEALVGGDVALISEAGMPGLSDPGYELIKAALEAGHPVVPVPGPVAAVTALVVSGLPTDRFLFLGFLPRRQSERRRLLASVAAEPGTLVAYEAPHRLCQALSDIAEVLGDRPIAVAEELTKRFESVWRGRVSEAVTRFQVESPRGEYTLVIGGAPRDAKVGAWPAERLKSALRVLLAEGLSPAAAVRILSKLTGEPHRSIYRMALEIRSQAVMEA